MKESIKKMKQITSLKVLDKGAQQKIKGGENVINICQTGNLSVVP